MPLEIVPVDANRAELAASFKAGNKFSLADAFAVALAKEKKAELIAGAPEFKGVEKEIRIKWLKWDKNKRDS